MDSKQSSKGAKKSQSSSHRKKKKQKKRDSQVRRVSDASLGGKFQREKDVGPDVGPGESQRAGPGDAQAGSTGCKDSGADTDSKDSGLEVDCQPQSVDQQSKVVPSPFLSARNQRELLVSSVEHESQLKSVNGLMVVKEDNQQDSKAKNPVASKDYYKSNGKTVKQSTSKQWTANNGGLLEQSSHVSTKRVLSTHQSLPNVNISQPGGAFSQKTDYREMASSTKTTAGYQPNSSSKIAQIKPASLRWENALQDSDEEAERIRIYKLNRRKRYIAASNEKYEDWLSSCSNTSLSCSSGSARGRKSASDMENNEGNIGRSDTGSGICATVMATHRGNKIVGSMYDEFSQLVINTHSQAGSNQRILLNC